MIDFDLFRRKDGSIILKDAFNFLLITCQGPHTLTNVSHAGLEAALNHIDCVEAFLPITSRQAATVVLANAYSLALAYTKLSQPKEKPTEKTLYNFMQNP